MVSDRNRKVTPLNTPTYIEDPELLEKVKKKRRRGLTRRLIAFFILFGATAVTMTSIITSQHDVIAGKREQKAQYEEKLTQLKSEEQRLKNEIRKLNDPAYVADIARREFLMTEKGSGEVVFTSREIDEN